ncbi:hypothetical protein GCM10010840_16160 [Deinococcus aerolatus]|uniref:Uncharacterized protein n=1 Tax=Deinococcus aerolatus TaxID=522487 RepID=A0ABQ2G8F8_9DEIO|nr:hypothetical protein [Deinococcus aerolatus]GGL79061.1 hypothetical protein GCM10010840_16160 [Deinococcus aerolatus]
MPDRARNPHYRALDTLFLKLNLREVNTNGAHQSALVGGKFSGGGYTAEALAHIATQTKADALYRKIDVIIFTPSPRKGQARAETHRSVMTLIHALPRADDTTRFTRIPRSLETYPHGNTPHLLPHQVEVLRARRSPLPDATLALLQQPLSARLAQARVDLNVDGVLSSSQPRRYYGLLPSDLTGRLSTVALMRPIGGRYALEVQRTLVVTDDMAALGDTDLNHRLTLAGMRLMLGVPADPARWKVDPRSLLKLNQPDAVWVSDAGTRHAVEADTGDYSGRLVERKLDSFIQQGYLSTLWGTPSAQRSSNLQRQFGHEYRVDWVHPAWWSA